VTTAQPLKVAHDDTDEAALKAGAALLLSAALVCTLAAARMSDAHQRVSGWRPK
jgi:hypothetical protein